MAGRGNKFSKQKYEERILNELNSALRREFADVRLQQVSLTRVELSQDYSMAKVYWDTFNSSTRGDAKTAIESIKGRMRTLLASKMEVRHTPELTFYYDSQFEDEKKIDDLLKKSSNADNDE
jgi:ribosome-binding factor A